jgi:excisionase family DNA binding protein
MTLAEAAAFLRVSEDDVVSAVHLQELPGREIKGQWRFLKSSLRAWLATPTMPVGNEALLASIGAWKDDPYVEDELKEIYRRRGRPMTEDVE